jgi:hypothetical protein
MKKIKRWIFGVTIAIATGFTMLNVFAYNHAYAMMHFTSSGSRTDKPEQLSFLARLKVLIVGVKVPRPVNNRMPSDLAPGCLSLSIAGTDNVSLAAWYSNQGKGTPLVILFHGYAAEKTCLMREAKVFLDLGASVLLVDFRGSGDSSESYTTIGIREGDDVSAVVRYAHDNLPHSSLILFGQSMVPLPSFVPFMNTTSPPMP